MHVANAEASCRIMSRRDWQRMLRRRARAAAR